MKLLTILLAAGVLASASLALASPVNEDRLAKFKIDNHQVDAPLTAIFAAGGISPSIPIAAKGVMSTFYPTNMADDLILDIGATFTNPEDGKKCTAHVYVKAKGIPEDSSPGDYDPEIDNQLAQSQGKKFCYLQFPNEPLQRWNITVTKTTEKGSKFTFLTELQKDVPKHQ